MSGLKEKIPRPLIAPLRWFRNHLPIYSRVMIRKDQEQLRQVETELQDAQVMISQLSAMIKESGGYLPPPSKLQKRVANRGFDHFLENGAATVREFERILTPVGQSLRSFVSILDFGVGCGRLARPLRAYVGPDVRLHGTDIDREAIEWCRRNYSGMAVFDVNDPWPPLQYQDNSFDFIYGQSVFTHLPEDMQFRWLSELNRVIKAQGYLILTTHGEGYYGYLSPRHLAELESKGFLYYNNGLTPGLPDFYQTTFHTHDYIRRRWAEHLRLISIESQAILGRHDAILCTKKE